MQMVLYQLLFVYVLLLSLHTHTHTHTSPEGLNQELLEAATWSDCWQSGGSLLSCLCHFCYKDVSYLALLVIVSNAASWKYAAEADTRVWLAISSTALWFFFFLTKYQTSRSLRWSEQVSVVQLKHRLYHQRIFEDCLLLLLGSRSYRLCIISSSLVWMCIIC